MLDVRSNKNQAGFSLVELMVVVAIIGILASLAIPSIGKYMAKARQSEAKTQLSSLYTAEKAFFAEYTAFDERFAALGYSPEGNLRYNVGFGAAGFVATIANGYTMPIGLLPDRSTITYCGAAGAVVNACSTLNGATNVPPPALPAANTTTSNTFLAGATAIIHEGVPAGDFWTITNNKILVNTASGIP